jgi:hypothetical protein
LRRRCYSRFRCRGSGYPHAIPCLRPEAVAGRTNSGIPLDEIIVRKCSIRCNNLVAVIVGDSEVEARTRFDEPSLRRTWLWGAGRSGGRTGGWGGSRSGPYGCGTRQPIVDFDAV